MPLPAWNEQAFGCLIRESVQIASLMRTAVSATFPAPFVSRTADTSAPVELDFALEMDDGEFRAWQQWYEFDLNDGSLPFTMSLPWGTELPQVRCRLMANWEGQSIDSRRWSVRGRMQIEREGLPEFSGGLASA